jgi:xanthine dehydrogenase large subunit
MNHPKPDFAPAATAALGQPAPHDSAHLHVSGQARYTDDIPVPRDTLHAALGLSTQPHANITALDLEPVRQAPGVVAVFTAADIPGTNRWGAIVHDEPFLAEGTTRYVGQPLFLVVATSHRAARRAARLGRITYEPLPALLTIEAAMAADSLLAPPMRLERGTPDAAMQAAPHRAQGSSAIGGQEHFYLEGQVALALPQEDGQMLIQVSSQHPTEMQQAVAAILGVPWSAVESQCRRLGGGFGGKEVQPAQFAALAALAARLTGRPVKLKLDRDDDMQVTGKRHDFAFDYDVGFDDHGRLAAFDLRLRSRCGHSADYSHQVNDRALCHVDNGYFHEHLRVLNHRCRTHTQSATAFRGFGAPQGMFAIEHAIETVARQLGRDPLDVRKANFYGSAPRNVTPYGQQVDGFWLPEMVAQLESQCDYRRRRAKLHAFNAMSPVVKRGLALTPVMFGVSFNAAFLNRASASVALYLDGSVTVNHAGTEMGQGLFIKMQQVVAQEFGLAPQAVRSTATNTSKLPNTSPTAASSGADLNGMAVLDACRVLKERLAGFLAQRWQVAAGDVLFGDGAAHTRDFSQRLTLRELAAAAQLARVPLLAQGFYATPDIHWDGQRFQGHPFYYFAYGAACSEVEVDTRTGEHRLARVDLLHDCGSSLNPAIDLGQIEGGFIQGVGYLTSEELVWDSQGRLRTHAPSTYKIPTAGDLPAQWNVRLFDRPNHVPTIHRSKAVGEPPLMLALSVWFAIADAVASLRDYRRAARMTAPATPEQVLVACDEMRASA